MEIKVNNYKPNEVFKFIRQSTDKTQKEFGNDIGKSVDWVQSCELGRIKYKFDDLVKLANINNIEITITKMESPKK